MLKCKYNEDCSHYPSCGHTCGLSMVELMRYQNERAQEYMGLLETLSIKLMAPIRELRNIHDKTQIMEYEPTCPCGYVDCVSDPAYIRCAHPEWWEELGMPTSCADNNYGKPCWEEYEDGRRYCQYYDDEDK